MGNKKQVNNNDPAARKMCKPREKGPSKKQKKIKPDKNQVSNKEPATPIMSSQRQSKIKIAKNCNKYKQYLIMKRQNQTKLQIIEKMKPDTNQYEVSSKKKDVLKLRKRNNIEKIKIKRENEIKKKRRAARFQRWKFEQIWKVDLMKDKKRKISESLKSKEKILQNRKKTFKKRKPRFRFINIPMTLLKAKKRKISKHASKLEALFKKLGEGRKIRSTYNALGSSLQHQIRFHNNEMDDLEKEIKRTKKERIKMKKYNKKALMKLKRSKKEFNDLETEITEKKKALEYQILKIDIELGDLRAENQVHDIFPWGCEVKRQR